MQGFERADRQLLDAEMLAGHLVPENSMFAFLATRRADLTRGNVMAPRGIVAAATAPTFSAQLAAKHVGGASKILPVTFLVIVGHGCPERSDGCAGRAAGRRRTPVPDPPAAGRRAGLGCRPGVRPGLGGPGHAGVGRFDEEREAIRRAGLELAPGELLASATARGAELDGHYRGAPAHR